MAAFAVGGKQPRPARRRRARARPAARDSASSPRAPARRSARGAPCRPCRAPRSAAPCERAADFGKRDEFGDAQARGVEQARSGRRRAPPRGARAAAAVGVEPLARDGEQLFDFRDAEHFRQRARRGAAPRWRSVGSSPRRPSTIEMLVELPDRRQPPRQRGRGQALRAARGDEGAHVVARGRERRRGRAPGRKLGIVLEVAPIGLDRVARSRRARRRSLPERIGSGVAPTPACARSFRRPWES